MKRNNKAKTHTEQQPQTRKKYKALSYIRTGKQGKRKRTRENE